MAQMPPHRFMWSFLLCDSKNFNLEAWPEKNVYYSVFLIKVFHFQYLFLLINRNIKIILTYCLTQKVKSFSNSSVYVKIFAKS